MVRRAKSTFVRYIYERLTTDKGILAMGESVNKLLAVGGLVCFDEGLAVGESIDKLLAVGGLVYFDKRG